MGLVTPSLAEETAGETLPLNEPAPIPLDYASPRPRLPPVPDGGRAAMGWAFTGAVLGGLACVFAGIGLSGFGHAWTSPCAVSWLAVVTSPAAVVAWGLRRRASGKQLALLLLLAAVVANVVLYAEARSEGAEYFNRSWTRHRRMVVAWAVLWAAWQVLALAALLWPRRPPRRKTAKEG